MIKFSPGDAADCDRRCDGDSNIANDEHTACGMIVMKVYGTELKENPTPEFILLKFNVFNYCLLKRFISTRKKNLLGFHILYFSMCPRI